MYCHNVHILHARHRWVNKGREKIVDTLYIMLLEFYSHGLHKLIPLERRVNINQYKVLLILDLYPMMKHLYPGESILKETVVFCVALFCSM